MHPSWSRRRRWTEFVCVESGLVLRILQATLGVSTDLLSTPNNALKNILPWQWGVGVRKLCPVVVVAFN